MPESEVNREYFLDQAERKIEQGQLTWDKTAPDQMLAHLSRTKPYYNRNLPRICSFFVKGECNRGKECPYRHDENPATEETHSAKQNIRDRYYGVDDPVANKILGHAKKFRLDPPQDASITTLYLGGVKSDITKQDLTDQFYPFGEIKGITLVPKLESAFVTYTTREAAEKAAEALYRRLTVKNHTLQLSWGHSSSPSQAQIAPRAYAPIPPQGFLPPPPGLGFAVPPPPGWAVPPGAPGYAVPFFPPPMSYYPSMDPTAMGSKGDKALDEQQQQQQQSHSQSQQEPSAESGASSS